MTAQELLALPDDQLDAVPQEEIDRILAEERKTLDRLGRRLDSRPKSTNEVAELLGISKTRVHELQTIALLKIRDRYPELRNLLEA